MSIGTRIKMRREELGMTQPELACLIGVSKGSIGNYESGISRPNEDILIKLQNKAEQFNYKFKYYYLFSKSGFNEGLYVKASIDDTIKLISLEEVYNYIQS